MIRELIDVRFKWDEPGAKPFRAEARILYELIWWGRYGSFFEALLLFRHRFQPSHVELERFTIVFSKLLAAHSIINLRITESKKTFLHDFLKRFASGSEETAESITRHVEELCASSRDDVLWALENQQLAWQSTKNLVCRLAAMLDEPEFPNGNAESLCEKLFGSKDKMVEIDIEHIEPCNHHDGSKRDGIWELWQNDLHHLGNLIILERDMNRGEVSNNPYAQKRESYRKSNFATVKKFAKDHEEWTLDKAQERKRVLAEQITNYLCGPSIPGSPDFPS